MDTTGESTARDEVTASANAGASAAANVARNVALNGQRAPGHGPGDEAAAGRPGARAARKAGGGGTDEDTDDEVPEEHDATWIYKQLGLSPEAYQGDRPRSERRGPSPMPPVGRRPVSGIGAGLDFDFNDLQPGDPHDSPFPPGSLGRDEDMPTSGPKAKPFIHHQGASTAPIIPGSVPASAPEPPAVQKADAAAAEKAVADRAVADRAVADKAEPQKAEPAKDEPAMDEPKATAPTPTTPKITPPKITPAERPRPAVDRSRPAVAARSVEPAPQSAPREESHNPFRAYDEREQSGGMVLPPLPPLPEPLRTSGLSHGSRYGDGPLPEDDKRVTADSLTADKVLKGRKVRPTRGWRKGLLSMGLNLGPSSKELAVQDLETRVRTPISGCHRLAVISLKGGVGKTTTIAAMGSMFASLRGDRVIAVDANPDRGTLGEKIVGEVPPATVRDFVGRIPRLTRYSDIREFIGQADSRLEVLASESDPLASLAFSEQDYRVISEVLERFYNLILTDCGTGLLHSAMVGVLAKAEQVVIVSSASLDGARSASATLDWLEAHGYQELARDSVSVISSVRVKADGVHLSEIEQHFASRTRAVVSIPYDEHLAEGGTIDLAALSPRTYSAYLELAATVGDGFARTVGYR